MAFAASDVFAVVRKTMLDGAARAFSNADLCSFLTDGLCSLANDKPDAYTREVTFTLAAGENQVLPADGVALFDIPSNTVTKGGRVVTQVQRDLLAEASRFWPAGTRVPGVEHYTVDERDLKRFKVYPPNDGTGEVNLSYGAVPPDVAAPGDVMVVADTYMPVLVNYVLARCYGVNSKKADPVKFNMYMNLYRQQLGLKTTSTRAVAPRVADVGETS